MVCKGAGVTKHKEALEALARFIFKDGFPAVPDDVKEALEKVRQALQAASWQPIETAPKDRVILIRNKTGTVFSGQWWDEDEGSEGWMMTGELNLFYDPIEWREMLPAAPVDGGG